MDALLAFKKDGKLPADKTEARKLQFKAQNYVFLDDVLLSKKFTVSKNVQPYLRCLTEEEDDYVLREIHEGICRTVTPVICLYIFLALIRISVLGVSIR